MEPCCMESWFLPYGSYAWFIHTKKIHSWLGLQQRFIKSEWILSSFCRHWIYRPPQRSRYLIMKHHPIDVFLVILIASISALFTLTKHLIALAITISSCTKSSSPSQSSSLQLSQTTPFINPLYITSTNLLSLTLRDLNSLFNSNRKCAKYKLISDNLTYAI